MYKCKMDCPNCKRFLKAERGNGKNCPSVAEGYYFINGVCVDNPTDYDGLDLGTATVREIEAQNGYKAHYNPYNGCYEV